MKKLLFNIIISFAFFGLQMYGQNPTVGLTFYDDEVSDGYVLFTPFNGHDSYLIDKCGRLINKWQGNGNPNFGLFLSNEGNLYRVSNGIIQIKDWFDNVIWSYDLAANNIVTHHDFVVLPDNNIIMIAKDFHSSEQALLLGKDSTGLIVDGQIAPNFNPDRLIEIEPIGSNDANLVWEWKYWDHLVQNKDSSLNNYGLLEDNPGKLDININYLGYGNPVPWDWLHSNGIYYNEELDQVLFSSRHTSEIYIIDHSTTIAEAASNSGGNYGKGGEFLWRWGNPQNYNTGTAADKKLFGPHNPRWIKSNFPNGNKISVFNNGNLRPAGAYSSVEIIAAPIDSDGTYLMDSNNKFLPDNSDFTWSGTVDNQIIFSDYLSSVEFFENGNFFINEGGKGRFMEFDENGNVLWVYTNPAADVITNQGSYSTFNWVFKAYKFKADYFEGQFSLFPSVTIESYNPITDNCYSATVLDIAASDNSLKIIQNNNDIIISSNEQISKVYFYDINGKLIRQVDDNIISSVEKGIYLIQIIYKDNYRSSTAKIAVR